VQPRFSANQNEIHANCNLYMMRKPPLASSA
jgi:hypothetical protein